MRRHNIFLITISIIGTIFILAITFSHGAGLSPDSVKYVGVAQNLIKGEGLTGFHGHQIVYWPPLYSMLLALVTKIIGIDPLLVTNLLNALIFGLIVYSGGVLCFKYFSSFPTIAITGTLGILISNLLFKISIMAWTEPLFILFVILSLNYMHSYLLKNNLITLVLLALFIALSSLTRYIGIILILWGVLIIILFSSNNFKKKISHLLIFTMISSIPICIFIIRNYTISDTLFGPRASLISNPIPNLIDMSNTLLYWFIPGRIVEYSFILAVIFLFVGFFMIYIIRASWQHHTLNLQNIVPVFLFCFIYVMFLLISSSLTLYDPIDNRLLSPVYIPLLLLLLLIVQMIFELYLARYSNKVMNSLYTICFVLWSIYPIHSTINDATKFVQTGLDLSSKKWAENLIIQYLSNHQALTSNYTIYSNEPYINYILTQLSAKITPSNAINNSKLIGTWPEENNAYIVWYENFTREKLLTIAQMRQIANVQRVISINDIGIYTVKKSTL